MHPPLSRQFALFYLRLSYRLFIRPSVSISAGLAMNALTPFNGGGEEMRAE